jgi:CDP-glucose 4,6-dehydratase
MDAALMPAGADRRRGALAMDSGFWRDKRVFMTGHTGFKGSWLALWLQALGARVTGFALAPPTRPSLFEQAGVAAGMTSLAGDIRDLPALERALGEHRPEIVLHLAAQSLVRRSYAEPVETYHTNVLGTVHLLEAVRRTGGVRAVVNVTSDKCYRNREWPWGYRENEPMGGNDPYSSSKGCAELVTAAYRRSFLAAGGAGNGGTALASARSGNVIGGGDWSEHRLVPDIVRAFLDKRPAAIRMPHAVRPWQHVLDPLAGYLLLARRLWDDGAAFADGWNFGPSPGEEGPVSSIVERIAALWGGGARWEFAPEEGQPEAATLRLDATRARLELGWRPRWPVDAALARTVEWYRACGAGADLQALTLAQIDAYTRQEPAP